MGEIKRFPKPAPRGFIEALGVLVKVFQRVWLSLDKDENGLSEYEVVGVEGEHIIVKIPMTSVCEFQIKGVGPPLETPR